MEAALGVFTANSGDEHFHSGLRKEFCLLFHRETEQDAFQVAFDFLSVKRWHALFYTREPRAPNMIKQQRRLHIPQAVFRDFAIAAFVDQPRHVVSGDTLALGRLDSKRFAVKVEVESACGPVPATSTVERK